VRGSSHAPKQRAKCVWPREVGSWHPWSQLVIDVLPIDCPDRRWSGAAGLVASKSCVGINKVQATVRGVCLCCCVCDESGCTLPHQSVGRPHMTFRRPSHTCPGVQHAARNGKPRRASKNTQHTRRWEGQGGRDQTPTAHACRERNLLPQNVVVAQLDINQPHKGVAIATRCTCRWCGLLRWRSSDELHLHRRACVAET
jgi:hypothetical protein